MAAAPLPLCHDRALTDATDPDATDPDATCPDATDPDATCPDATCPTGSDPTHTGPTGPDPTPTAVVIRPGSLVDLDQPRIAGANALTRAI